jgi:hypothetical protein
MHSSSKQFETARTRQLRSTQLNEVDERTVRHIEEYGCSIVSVMRSGYGLGWSYTIGAYDTSRKPEIITVGLSDKTAHFALNEAAKLSRAGVDLTHGRHRNLVGKVDCEFRPVDQKWVKHLMNWAVWYYGGEEFPVLQAVYPTARTVSLVMKGSIKTLSSLSCSLERPWGGLNGTFGLPQIVKAVYSNGSSPTPRTRRRSFRRRSTSGRSRSHTSLTTPTMELGSFWATAWTTEGDRFSSVFTTRSTTIRA